MKILSWLKQFISGEPAAAGGAIAGVVTGLLVKYGHVDPSAAHEVAIGAVPFVGSLILRQFVSPARATLIEGELHSVEHWAAPLISTDPAAAAVLAKWEAAADRLLAGLHPAVTPTVTVTGSIAAAAPQHPPLHVPDFEPFTAPTATTAPAASAEPAPAAPAAEAASA